MTTDQIVDFLNKLVAADQRFVQQLIECRHEGNEEIVANTTVHFGINPSGMPTAGFLGVLNGLIAYDDPSNPYVGALFDDNRLIGFKVIA
jgi:hypothetical protein